MLVAMRGLIHAAKETRPAVEISLVLINLGLLAAIVVPAVHS
jgi:hypothetical protein